MAALFSYMPSTIGFTEPVQNNSVETLANASNCLSLSMNKYLKLFLAAVIATIAVSGYNYVVGPLLGLPTFQRTRLISSIFHVGLAEGWLLNLTIGVVFSLLYMKLFLRAIPDVNWALSGLLFGFFVFIILQLIYSVFVSALPQPGNYLETESFMKKLIINSLIGNLLFGFIVALFTGRRNHAEE